MSAQRLARARALDERGEDEAAKAAYLEYLRDRPDDVTALLALGNLAYRTRYRRAAVTAYRRAVELEPHNVAARVNLGNALLDAADYDDACAQFEAALDADPDFAPAHQGMSYALTRLGLDDRAAEHRERGFRGNALTRVPYRGRGNATRVLVFVCAAGGNFNTEWLLDARRYDVVKVAAGYAGGTALPPADVAVNAIGDAELCPDALHEAARIARERSLRVVNDPGNVLRTSRRDVARRLSGFHGIVVPRIEKMTKARAAEARTSFEYPVLLRTPGHHTGRNFVRADSPQEAAIALDALPGAEVLVISFIDVRSGDGRVRKYRVLHVGGTLYPVHAAVSNDWKVHHFSAGSGDAERDEDAAFVRDPRSVVGAGVYAALEAAARDLSLDYCGIDFSVTNGKAVIFEANATMSVVPPPDGDERLAYRRAVFENVRDAFEKLLRVYRTA